MLVVTTSAMGFPGGTSGKEPSCQCKRPKRRGFDPWVGKIPWRRARQPILVFLPGEAQGQKVADYSPGGYKELDTTEVIYHARNTSAIVPNNTY